MNEDVFGTTTLMLVFGLLLVIYGWRLFATGDKNLLPLNAMHSVRTKDDVRKVGRYTAIVGAVIAALAAVSTLLFR